MAVLKKLNLRDRSTDTKTEYIVDHILWSVLFGTVAYFSFPMYVPLLIYERSVAKVVISMALSGLVGFAISFSYNRKTSGTVLDTLIGLGTYIFLTLGLYLKPFLACLLIITAVLILAGIFAIWHRKIVNQEDRKRIICGRLLKCCWVARVCLGAMSAVILIGVLVIQYFGGDKASINAAYKDKLSWVVADQYDLDNEDRLTVKETYGDDCGLDANMDTIKLIRDRDVFASLTYSKKCEVLEAIIRCEAHYLGLPEIKVEFEKLDDEIAGQSDCTTNTITINEKVVKKGKTEKLLETCCHESRHIFQGMMCSIYRKISPEQRNLQVFTKEDVASWVLNYENYIEDGIHYKMQPLEADAREYAYLRGLVYYTKIDELVQ